MSFLYKKLIRPVFFHLDAERAHEIVCSGMSWLEKSNVIRYLLQKNLHFNCDEIHLFGLKFPNRIGLAAGLDKNGMFPGISSALGFGHIEVGTVTPVEQSGNAKPRLFRYEEQKALINRMGFNNFGATALVRRIARYYPKGSRYSPLGINIGKGKATVLENAYEDYVSAFETVASQADYITVNISSPNTPGLRKLQNSEYLEPLLKKIIEKKRAWDGIMNNPPLPVLLKISPDETFAALERLIGTAVELGFSGVIATNTSIVRDHTISNTKFEQGGLSGLPIEKRSLEVINFIAKLTDYKFPIIGVGGVSDSETAMRKLDAGASMLQLYTAFVYEGPLFPSRLAKRISQRKSWF